MSNLLVTEFNTKVAKPMASDFIFSSKRIIEAKFNELDSPAGTYF